MTESMPVLYKKTTTGAIQRWWMERDGARHRTHSGQVDGAVVTSEWTVCEGKNVGRANETSPEEQARREVASEYTLKRKKGYMDTAEEAGGSNIFRVMLALKYEDYDSKFLFDDKGQVKQYDPQRDYKPGVWLQPKLDGIRCVATANGLWSREGNPIVAVPHIERLLKPFFKKHPEAILDGELYNHDLHEDFNQIVSLVKKQKPSVEHVELTEKMVEYWIYDGLHSTQDTRRWYERFFNDIGPEINDMVGREPEGPWKSVSERKPTKIVHSPLVVVPSHYANDRQQLDTCYLDWLLDGFEGLMVRFDVAYQIGKRTKYLLKRKEFEDEEYTILDIREGVGNAAGLAKIAEMELADGRTFKADIVGTRDQLREMYRRREEAIGKQATITRFKQLTPDGKPRFPKLKVVHFTSRW
jgi:DNA ligase 1